MTDFFDQAGAAVEASIEYFPASGGFDAACNADYASPAVPLTPLASPEPLVESLGTREPSGGTPTLPALRGAVEYAGDLRREAPNALVEVVVITDGEPAMYEVGGRVDECPSGDALLNTVDGVAAVARAAYEGVPSVRTHVLALGDTVDALSIVANAGGTEFVAIPAAEPEVTRGAIAAVLRSIAAPSEYRRGRRPRAGVRGGPGSWRFKARGTPQARQRNRRARRS